jgi:hypothetical protein
MIRSALALDQDLRVSSPPAFDRLRLISLLYSAAVHGWLLCLVAFGPRQSPSVRRPIYDSIIRPNERKIIWYRKVPDIVPSTQISDIKRPQGKLKSNKTIVVKSPNPMSSRQLVLQPAPQIKLDHDIQAPNLIALTAAPSLPRPPEPKPVKRFIAPPAAIQKPAAAAPLLAEPALRLTTTGTTSTLAPLTLPSLPARAQAKPFVAPAATGKLHGADPRLGEPDSNLSGNGTGSVPGTVPNLSGASNLNAAIIGLNPSGPIPSMLPPGSRSAEFSAAPTVGTAATGDVKGGGITLPGLLVKDGVVKDGKTEGPSAEAIPSVVVPRFRTLLYDELVPASIRPTLSAPLRPASRTIPRALEARFHGRLVYAVVIPAPNLPAYTGDWILWFAEQAQKPGEAPLMRAPIPLRKTEPLGVARVLSDNRSEARIQLAAIIKKDGRFDSVVLVRGPNPQVSQNAIEELKRWDFRPAMRDGAPTAVEIVIEIPFNLDWLSSAQ